MIDNYSALTAQFLDERRVMMEQYPYYLEGVAGGEVMADNFGRKAA